MSPKTKSKTQSEQIADLQHEVAMIRSFMIGLVARDPEGEYRPEFVEQMLKINREKPMGKINDIDEFFSKIK